MPELRSADGQYLAVEQGDRNFVVYLAATMQPLFDRFSYEATHDTVPALPPGPSPVVPGVVPTRPPVVPQNGVRVIRVTDDRDGIILNRGYAYWPQAWVTGDLIYVFCGKAGERVQFFSVHRKTGEVLRLGPLLPYGGTGEGWYWDAGGWVSLCDGPRLRRCNPFTGEDVVVFDVSGRCPGHDIWQAHSSDDGQTHSATLRRIVSDGPYTKVNTVVFRNDALTSYPTPGVLDESQITPDGGWLLIKFDDDNLIVNLATDAAHVLPDSARALGHSDCGPSCAIGEADKPDPGACVYWDFATMTMRVLFHTTGMGHVSYRDGLCLLSDATRLSLFGLGWSVALPLLDHGMTGGGYDHQVHANLSPCGRVAAYVSNVAGRMDLYVVEL